MYQELSQIKIKNNNQMEIWVVFMVMATTYKKIGSTSL